MNEFKIFAEHFAKRAGNIMRENFSLGMKKEWKADNSPVTETDKKINSLLIQEVQEKFPGHGIKGEEESSASDNEYVWVCDPVDGTIPFSHGIPLSTFSLALVKNGESILGIGYDPFQERLFSATKGEGAFLNGKRIHVSSAEKLKGTAGEFEMFETAQFDITQLEHRLMFEGVKMMKFCSIVYPSMLVAAGELAFTIFPHTTAHDGAAVKIIVEEAGGKVTDIFGQEQRYNSDIQGFIASNGILHDQLISLAKELVINNTRNKF